MNRIYIVLVAFFGASAINLIELSYKQHYFAAVALYFVMFLVCIKSKDKLVYIYAYVNVIMLAFCVNMLLPSGFYAVEYWVYDSFINLSDAVICYEIILLITGVYNVLLAVANRHRNAFNLRNYHHKGVSECRKKSR